MAMKASDLFDDASETAPQPPAPPSWGALALVVPFALLGAVAAGVALGVAGAVAYFVFRVLTGV